MTSGQEMERVYSYNSGAHMGPPVQRCRWCWTKCSVSHRLSCIQAYAVTWV